MEFFGNRSTVNSQLFRIIGDNYNATNWAVEKMISDGNRHIDIMYMEIRERVAMGVCTWIIHTILTYLKMLVAV